MIDQNGDDEERRDRGDRHFSRLFHVELDHRPRSEHDGRTEREEDPACDRCARGGFRLILGPRLANEEADQDAAYDDRHGQLDDEQAPRPVVHEQPAEIVEHAERSEGRRLGSQRARRRREDVDEDGLDHGQPRRKGREPPPGPAPALHQHRFNEIMYLSDTRCLPLPLLAPLRPRPLQSRR